MVENIYARALPGMNPRVRAYVEWLDAHRQIDRDANGDPIITRMDRIEPNNWRVFFQRNRYEENFIMNPRKRPNADGVVEPIKRSWEAADGYSRQDEPRKQIGEPSNPRGERARRDYRRMMESILDGSTEDV